VSVSAWKLDSGAAESGSCGGQEAMKTIVEIRPPVLADMAEFTAAAKRSKVLHSPWIIAPDTAAKYEAYLERMALPANHGFLICRRDTAAIVGVINLTNVIQGFFQCGFIGYYAFAGHERQGLMQAGLKAMVRHAFKTMKLHRMEANIQPGNAGSIALAASCGFKKEGFSPRYLKVRGRWRDHERWAILAD
jgi:ribosomal-protein-alanine N-acetyltransferase